MATLYIGPHFWDERTYEITVKANGGIDRKIWIADMMEWAKQHSMRIEWSGESTHTSEDQSWHEAHFYIPDPKDRTMFALRWGA